MMTLVRRAIATSKVMAGLIGLAVLLELITLPRGGFALLLLIFFLLEMSSIILVSRTREPTPFWMPAPATSGVAVIVLTGASAALVLALNAGEGSSYVLPALIAVLMMLTSIGVFRFATKHRHHIGEARFRSEPDARQEHPPRPARDEGV